MLYKYDIIDMSIEAPQQDSNGKSKRKVALITGITGQVKIIMKFYIFY